MRLGVFKAFKMLKRARKRVKNKIKIRMYFKTRIF